MNPSLSVNRAWRNARPLALSLCLLAMTAAACDCGSRLQHITGDGVVNPDSLDFGTVTLGQSARQSFTLSNVGAAPLTLLRAGFADANASDFSLPLTLDGRVMSPGDVMTIAVVFSPLDAGTRVATLALDTDSTSNPTLRVALTGVGIDIQLCPAVTSLDFGPVQINGTKVSQQLVINNCGRSPADLSLSPIEGAQAADFSLSGATSATLQPGDTFSITVQYAPTALGPSTADVPFKACAACSPSVPIALSGTGVDGALTLSPSPVQFAAVNVGQTSMATVVATNGGSAAINITSLKLRGATSPFSLVTPPALPIALAPGATVSLGLKFSATAGGSDADDLDAQFTVQDPAVAARPATDHLTATANVTPCALAIAPVSLSFGTVPLGSSAKRQVTLTNSGGTACAVTGIALGAGSNPFFALAPPVSATATVPANGSASIAVNFAPTAPATSMMETGTLVFHTPDPANANVSIPLTANTVVTAYSAGWPKWHFDNFNTGQTQADTSGLTGKVAWKFNVGTPKWTDVHAIAGRRRAGNCLLREHVRDALCHLGDWHPDLDHPAEQSPGRSAPVVAGAARGRLHLRGLRRGAGDQSRPLFVVFDRPGEIFGDVRHRGLLLHARLRK